MSSDDALKSQITNGFRGYLANYNSGAILPANATVGEAIKHGRKLRVDCVACGRRFFDLKGALTRKQVALDSNRNDLTQMFRCSGGGKKRPCHIKAVAFIVRDCDVEWS